MTLVMPKPETKIRFETKAQKDRIERYAKLEKRSLYQFIVIAAEEKVLRMAQQQVAAAQQQVEGLR
jgi:uncharacterized protein (DUF1778 family)